MVFSYFSCTENLSMRKILLSFSLFITLLSQAQKTENIIVITTDGFRWQELFKGMDETLARDGRFNQDDSTGILKSFGAASETEKRKKLMPFFWNTIAKGGQIYGNRTLGSKVNVTNPYWFSYPGYNEILSGYADERINSNDYPPNPNTTIIEFFNQQPALKGKVGTFGAWEAFNRILNEQRSGVPVVAAYDTCGGKKPNVNELMINKLLRDSQRQWPEECFDVFTHHAAMEYLKKEQPKVMYIAYGETDEWAHGWKYKYYLNAAQQVDQWIAEIWNYIQSTPAYKNKTTIFAIYTRKHLTCTAALAVPEILCVNGDVAFTCITVTKPIAKPIIPNRYIKQVQHNVICCVFDMPLTICLQQYLS